jgi:hypothetical protein
MLTIYELSFEHLLGSGLIRLYSRKEVDRAVTMLQTAYPGALQRLQKVTRENLPEPLPV